MNKFQEFLNDSILKDLFIHYLQNEFEFKITLVQKGYHDIGLIFFPPLDRDADFTQKEYKEIDQFKRLLLLPIKEKLSAIGAHDIVNLYSREPNTYKTREQIRNDFRFALANKYGRNYKRMIENEIKNLFGVM